MTPHADRRTLFIAATTALPGLSAVSQGLVRAFERQGLRVAFAKPVADHAAVGGDGAPSADLAGPIPARRAEAMIRAGQRDGLLEEIVERAERARGDSAVLVVEGPLPDADHPLLAELGRDLGRSLAAEVIAVVSGDRPSPTDVLETVADTLYHQGAAALSGVVITSIREGQQGDALKAALAGLNLPCPLVALFPGESERSLLGLIGGAAPGRARGLGEDDASVVWLIEHIADHVARGHLTDPSPTHRAAMPPPLFRHRLVGAARAADRRIVLPEGDEPRTLRAAAICAKKGIARCLLLGDPSRIRALAQANAICLPDTIEILDPELVRGRYVEALVEMRRAKGLTAVQATAQLEDTVVLGTVMLALGEVDGLVSGAVHTTASTVRPALQLIKTAPGASIVSSVFFMLMPDQVLVYGDCAINPNPTAEQLADIAIQSADSALAFGIEPRVAMISYSTGSSGVGDDVEKVRAATALAKLKRPDLMIDGPMQYDAASVESVGRQKAPDSPVAGRANVFVFPDLNTGNTTYKAVQRSANVVSVGPMLQGLRKPVNDLSRGALVDDIVYTIALTAIQADQGADPMAEKVAAE
ncbi:phosphate acetyltransferase [Rhodospirillum rubrum]|nr:phosphate acetyltransferase [Rhodospirillum rubrum]